MGLRPEDARRVPTTQQEAPHTWGEGSLSQWPNNPVVSQCLKMGIYDQDMHKPAPVSPYRHAVTLAICLLGRIVEMEQKVHLRTAGFFDSLLTMAYSMQD